MHGICVAHFPVGSRRLDHATKILLPPWTAIQPSPKAREPKWRTRFPSRVTPSSTCKPGRAIPAASGFKSVAESPYHGGRPYLARQARRPAAEAHWLRATRLGSNDFFPAEKVKECGSQQWYQVTEWLYNRWEAWPRDHFQQVKVGNGYLDGEWTALFFWS